MASDRRARKAFIVGSPTNRYKQKNNESDNADGPQSFLVFAHTGMTPDVSQASALCHRNGRLSQRRCARVRRRTRARLRASPDGGRVTLSDINVVDAPAFTGNAAVTSHPPAEDKLDEASTRETHHGRVDKSGGVTGPCLPTSQGIATATVDRSVVTAENKRATDRKDVLKGQPVIVADLQHPAIEPILKVKVVTKGYLHRAGIADQFNLGERSCLSLIVAGSSTKTALGSVSAGGFGTPELDVTHVVLDQPAGSAGGVTPSKNSMRNENGLHGRST